jgi:choline kinase
MLNVTGMKWERGLSRAAKFDGVAIVLAAGVGRRLGEHHQGPKVLLDFAGRSLLRRTMDALAAHGVERIAITVGFEAETIRDAVAAILETPALRDLEVSFVENADYREGSLVSLHSQAASLRSGGEILLMDGDVLYAEAMIARLMTGEGEGVLLVDREIEPGDEPVKICFDDQGRIVDFRKRPSNAYAWFGESVGFFRFSGRIAAALADRCAWYVDRGLVKTEYEEAIRDLILAEPGAFRAEDVSDLPWTEIDFPEDVVRARDVVLPQLEA